MSVCRLCRIDLDEGERCEDTEKCGARVRQNVQKTTSRLVTRPFVGEFDVEKAYKEAMGRE